MHVVTPLTEVSEVGVGTMNPDVALRAVLENRTGHVMRRPRLGLDAVRLTPQVAGAIVAFQAHRKYHRPRQHPGIGGAVRNVAGEAPIHADRGMLKKKRPAFVAMTVDARFFVGLGMLTLRGRVAFAQVG
jgi:hypothetical protein